MLVDLVVAGKNALVVGGDGEAEFKADKLLDSRANVTVLGEKFTRRLSSLAGSKKLKLVKVGRGRMREAVGSTLESVRPSVVFISTGDPALDKDLAESSKAGGAVVCVVDTPSLNDINMPAVAKFGDIRVAISTGGSSPAMASILRKRVEALITPEDILQVRLQGYIRKESRKHLRDAESRKKFVYSVIRKQSIRTLLKKNRYEEAKAQALEMLLRAR